MIQDGKELKLKEKMAEIVKRYQNLELYAADRILSLFAGYLSPEQLKQEGWVKLDKNRPRIICLCGSTRFTEQMLIKQWKLTKQGNIVLSWCALPDSYFKGGDRTHIGDQEGVKKIVDKVHFQKIDIADEVLVINIGGYVGESTRNEINHAIKTGKPVKYLES